MKRTLITLGIGAGLMYLFDPREGATRRAQLKEAFEGFMPKTNEALHDKVDAVAAKAHDLADKADGATADAIASAGPQAGDQATTPVKEAASEPAMSAS